MAPFHIWIPDVYEGSSIIITGFLSTIVKLGVLLFFFEFYYYFCFNLISYVCVYIYICILLSLMIGSFGGLFQFKIKRLWGYSSLSHISLIFINLLNFSVVGISLCIFYIYIYLLISFSIFIVLITIKRVYTGSFINHLNDLRILSQTNFEYSFLISISMFSIVGIPPLAGFFSKLLVFNILSNYKEFVILFFIIFFSVITSFYYVRFVRKLFFWKSLWVSFVFSVKKIYVIILLILSSINWVLIWLIPNIFLFLNLIVRSF